jgi:hypothetical protein
LSSTEDVLTNDDAVSTLNVDIVLTVEMDSCEVVATNKDLELVNPEVRSFSLLVKEAVVLVTTELF